MILIGLVGGLITGISPCVLPVLPVVFLSGGVQGRQAPVRRDPARPVSASTRQGKRAIATATRVEAPPADSRRRPYLVVLGLAISFSAFTLLGTIVLRALHLPQDFIRWAGLTALVLLGIAMLFDPIQHLLELPFQRLGRRQIKGQHGGFVLGLALGAVYVPCAGPVLAAITVAGATGKIGLRTVALTIAFAIGAAIPLLIFALAGRGVAERVRAFRDRQRGVRIAAGLLVIGLAVALTFNVTDILQRAIPDYTQGLNKDLNSDANSELNAGRSIPLAQCVNEPSDVLQNCGKAGAITGIQAWLNTPEGAPVTAAQLAGKVTIVDFWAYSCINCQRAIPHVEAWYRNYHVDGLEVIGVHTPEYAFEHVTSNVAAGAQRLHITYPVALDNDYKTWNDYSNDSWPAEYLIDGNGLIRHVAIGEGDYQTTERLVRQLLEAEHPAISLPPATEVADTTPSNQFQTPEMYLGSARADSNSNPPKAGAAQGSLANGTQTFSYPSSVPEDSFALTGTWTIAAQPITAGTGAGIKLNFDASNVYLDVGGSGTITATVAGKSTTYHVSGAPDIYTVASSANPRRATVTISLSAGLTAYSFTFG